MMNQKEREENKEELINFGIALAGISIISGILIGMKHLILFVWSLI